jgi:hypothetical protein
MTGSWLAMALASLVIPWALYLAIPIDTLPKAVAPAALWAALWPVLVGALLAFGLDRLGTRIPKVPAGDVGEVLYPLEDASVATGGLLERVDAFARRWVVSCIALLLVSLLFGWTLMVAG